MTKMRTPLQSPGAPCRPRWLGTLLLLLFLVIQAAASHALHAALHHDAGAPEHQCVLVQVAAGQFLGISEPLQAPQAPGSVSFELPLPATLFLTPACPILPGRAPPASCL